MKYLFPYVSNTLTAHAALAAAIIVLLQAPVESATIVVDENNLEYYDADEESYFFYYDLKKSQDPHVLGEFLETTSSSGYTVVSAYNDGDGVANTPSSDNSYTTVGDSLTLAQAGSLIYEGTSYIGFYLDANQSGTDDGALGNNYYDVNKLEIYTSANATVNAYDNGGSDDVVDGNLAYSFDKSVDNSGDSLRLFYGTGTANWDIVLYVPTDKFTLIDTDPNVADIEETYIQFYVEYHDTAGADSWGYDRGADIIPEPSSILLISLGPILGMIRRRRLSCSAQ